MNQHILDELKRRATGLNSVLSEHEANQVLEAYGIPVVSQTAAGKIDEAVSAADRIGFPVVLKGFGPTLMHKTEHALVHLHLKDKTDVRKAAESMAAKAGDALEGYLVQPLVKGEREWVAGMFRDPQFGPVIMFGCGGVLTEAIADVVFRLAPLSQADISEIFNEIRTRRLLDAFRGEAAVDKIQLSAVLNGLSDMALAHPEISEVDINPLITQSDGSLTAVDVLIMLKTPLDTTLSIPRMARVEVLRPIFYPRSIAFVGASAQLGKWGHMLIANTIQSGYAGEVYPVNPKGGTIVGKTAYRSLADIHGEVDLAVVTLPASLVVELIPQLKQKGIKSVLLITSGFGETDAEGKAMEKQIVALAREAGIQILGPNTMGICNPHINFNCTSMPVNPRPGSTALVSQSGNMGTQFLAFAEHQGIGIRVFCGSGNEAMTTIEDFLETFESDELTRTVMLYIESVKDGRRFFESARRVGRKKPIILMKGGQTQAGTKAASSHTGAMSSDARIFNAMCRQAGIVKVEKSMDLLDLAAGFSSLPLPGGNRTAIMTLGGGWGVVTADLCNQYGLEVPELSETIIAKIDQWLPSYWSRSNPIDLVGEHDNALPINVIESLLQWDGCDAVINLGIMGRKHLVALYLDAVKNADPFYETDFLDSLKSALVDFETMYVKRIVSLMETYQKPVIGVSLLTDELDRTIYMVEESSYKGVFFTTPERAVKTLSKMNQYNTFLKQFK